MAPQTIADIVGSGAAVALGAVGRRASVIWLTAHGSSNARFGDSSVAAARGVELPADTLCTFRSVQGYTVDSIDLSEAYVYVPNGTTVTVAYGV